MQKKVARKALRQIKNADMEKVINNVSIGVTSLLGKAFELYGNFFRDLGNSLESYGKTMIEAAKKYS